MKIVAFDLESWEKECFEELGQEHEVVTTEEPLERESAQAYKDADAISTFLYSDLGRETLEVFDDLGLIATRSTGFDHIDLDYCRDNGILVANVPDYGKNTVAEHVFGLLLTISHRMYDAIDRTRTGSFSPKGLQGFDLQGRTLGVIGTGDIGRSVIRIAKGFGMDVVAFDVARDEEAAEELGFEYLEMEALLQRADVVTLHVPGNEKTKHLLSDGEFDLMKEGTVLINTSRGQVVDPNALVRALAEGRLKAAGLDVLPEEPVISDDIEVLRAVYQDRHNVRELLADHALMRLRNVYITPHNAYNTCEALERIRKTTMENIRAFARDEPQNVVN